jgi:hypothetical protein
MDTFLRTVLTQIASHFVLGDLRKFTDQYGAFKTGSHDDLVVALGLAVWLGNELGTRTVTMW